MTRETKIGLLVGLAFIIVIGILLSDHLTSSTEPPPATLANAGSSVMQTINTPGSSTAGQAQQIAPPAQVQPNATVPTRADLTPPQQPLQIVQVGPGSAQLQPAQPITVHSDQPQPQPAPQQPHVQIQPPSPLPITQNDAPPTTPAGTPVITLPQPPAQTSVAQNTPEDDSPIITQVPTHSAPTSLTQVAQQHGEELVGADFSGRTDPAQPQGPPSWAQALTGMQEYEAQPNDTVSRMAARFMGANTKANRDAIVKANPSLQKDPDRVIVGHKYLIPVSAAGATETASAAPAQTEPRPTVPTSTVETTASATEYWYTVKPNDSLWKIAEEQLGDPNARAAIKELNKLQDENKITVGMKLRLPGKPLAQAN